MRIAWLHIIKETGITAQAPEEEARGVMIVNLFSFFTACLVTLYGIVFYFISHERWVLFPALALCGCFISVIGCNARHWHSLAKVWLQLIFCIVILYYGPTLGETTEVQILALLLVAVPFLVFHEKERRLRTICLLLPLLCLAVLEYNNHKQLIRPFPLSSEVQYAFRWLIIAVVVLLNMLVIWFYQSSIDRLLEKLRGRNAQLEEQRTRLDEANALLQNNNAALEKLVQQRTAELVRKNTILENTLDDLRRKNDQLHNKEEELQQIVAALRDAHMELSAAKEKAEKASREKSDFVRDISHEIRNPLNAIMGIAHLFMRQSPDREALPAEEHRMMQNMYSASFGLLEMMNNNLEISRIEQGLKEYIQPAPFDLREWIQSQTFTYQVLADVKGLQLQLSVASDLPAAIVGDKAHLARILNNLILNAIKFTPKGKSIQVAYYTGNDEATGARWFIRVADEGIGIPREKLERIFLPFEQAGRALYQELGGSGLGLAIARRLAEKMNGAISVSSPPGQGATFLVSLPLQPAHLPKINTGATAAAAVQAPPGKKVLLMEDNEMNRVIMSKFIRNMGISVDTADNGIDGLRMAGMLHPDLIILDMRMPGKDGRQVAREIREDPELCHIPLIAVSADAFTDQQQEALNCGVDEYLVKPVGYGRLQELIIKYLAPEVVKGEK
jgi:signal transduction histidine kinase/CheY-like chemotaxis protein